MAADKLDTAGAVDAVLSGNGFDPAVPLRQSVVGAMDSSPEFEAELRKAAKRTGVSLLAARVVPDEVKRAAQVQAMDLDGMVRQYPRTARWLMDQENARLSHDDTGALSGLEAAAKYLTTGRGGVGGDLVAGVYKASAGVSGVARAAVEFLAMRPDGQPANQALQFGIDTFSGLARDAEANAKAWGLQSSGIVSGGVSSGVQSFAQNALMLPLALLPGGQGATLAGMSGTTGGLAYSQAREKGLPVGQAIPFAASQAAIEYATEKIPLGKLVGDVKAGTPLFQMLARQVAAEVPGEQVATLLQDLNEWAVLNPGKPFSEYLAERPSAAAQTLIATVVGVGGNVALTQSIQAVADRAQGVERRAQQAERQAQVLSEVATLAEASKLRERDPEAFQQFAQEVADSGAPSLFVDARVLMQSGVDIQAVAQALPSVAAQVQRAIATGGDLVIPVGEFLALAPGQEFLPSLVDNARTAEHAMSAAEAKQYMAERGDQIQAEVARVLGERAQDDAAQAERDQLREQFAQQLQAAGRRPEVAQAEAAVVAAFFSTQAQRLGMSAGELAQRYALQVQGKLGGGGRVLEQGASKPVETPEFKEWFGDSKVVDAKGKPLVVYHGTSNDVTEFEASQSRNGDVGIWFTDSPSYADWISGKQARKPGRDAGANTVPVYLSMQSPKVIDILEAGRKVAADIGEDAPETPMEAQRMLAYGQGWDAAVADMRLAAEDEGHDGLILKRFDDNFPGGETVAFVAFRPEQIKSAIGNRGTFDPSSPNILEQPAYHGTPYRGIDKFSTDKIGTGEGAQAYGWGLYFAGKKEIAEWYREKLSGGSDQSPRRFFKGEEFQPGTGGYFAARIVESSTLAKARKDVASWIKDAETWSDKRKADKGEQETLRVWRDALDILTLAEKKSDFTKKAAQGQLYEVDIPEDSDMLLWDKPLSEQPEIVARSARTLKGDIDAGWLDGELERRNVEWEELTGQDLYMLVQKALVDDALVPKTGSAAEQAQIDGQTDKAASLLLADDGIKGIKYLDGTSRGAGDGSYNYVIFSGDDVAITGTLYQQARGQIAMAEDITQAPSVITLLRGADLSTFIHEAGHFFLEVQADMAARIEGMVREGASVSDGEQQILADTRALLAWFGVQDAPEASALTQWLATPIDERRDQHEKFARGFEAYAFEGRAPSVELQGVFQRFRSWLLQVYRSLKGLNVELTDEVRGVMDRMLASDAQIKESEAARQMGPLFATAEQAGMTAEQWADYQQLAAGATAEAIERLQARGLKDLKWLDNARSRKLKELQRMASGLRREVEREVRVEVMTQPVYRAWAFLTGKGDAQDMAQPDAKTDPQALDVTRDSLLVAIAKLGGLSRPSAARDAGVHPDYFNTESGVFGKPVFRKDGGVDADTMAERLMEAHYLMPDEHGRHSLADLEAAIADELGGSPRYSLWKDYTGEVDETQVLPEQSIYGRLSTSALREMYGNGPDALWRTLSARKMTSDSIGVAPDLVANTFGFDSGDALARALAEAQPPRDLIRDMTNQRMLERFGDLATPEGLERAADDAIHNAARGRFIAAELDALQQAGAVRADAGTDKRGRRRTVDVLAKAARDYAAGLVAGLRVSNIRPAQYEAAAARAAKQAQDAMRAGDTAAAAEAQRNRLIQHEAARAAIQARDEVQRAVEYFRRFDKRVPGIAPDYQEQIDALLERFDLRQSTSQREIAKRRSLVDWVNAQVEQGMQPDIDAGLLNEARRQSYKELTVEEIRGLRDAVKQMEHLGRVKRRLLTSRAQREFEAARDEVVGSIEANAGGRQADTRSPATVLGKRLQAIKRFGVSHIKAAMWARIMDGGKDGGAVWEYFARGANERADMEATMRAEATEKLHAILAPVLKAGSMSRATFYASIGRSMTREQVIAMALNTGNAGNLQRMLGGEGWTIEQVRPVLQSLNAAEWKAAQQVWDLFESYRPLIGAKERRVYGVEPKWIEPTAFDVTTADGQTLNLRGGYYPINYDPVASQRAEQHADAEDAKRQMQGAYTSATTRRGFTKARAEEVRGRPLLYSLSTVYGGVNDVIHDLAWHEWLIDTNKLLKSDKVDAAIRNAYGPEVVREFKQWVEDIATGDRAAQRSLDVALGRLRRGASIAGMGFNVMSAAMQPLGMTNSIVRVGAAWIGRGVMRYISGGRPVTREVNQKSEFMRNRARTRFREMDEIRNRVEGQTAVMDLVGRHAFTIMMRCQQLVDYPTWLGAYEKATAEGNDEARAVSLADQAVIDAQGGGQTKDLAGIERGGPIQKVFTTFYSYMNTTLNLGVAQTMVADTPAKKAKLAADYLLLFTVPAVFGALLKSALTPGDSGDWDEWDKVMRRLLAEQLSFLFGTVVIAREFSEIAKTLAGVETFGYSGPGGLRAIPDSLKLVQQAAQGEFDDSFRKAAFNAVGSWFGLPSAQVNRTWTGVQAVVEGKTDGPVETLAAPVFGFQEAR